MRAVMDFFWKDKRTKKYRYIRNGFISTAICAALLNVVVMWIDEERKTSKAASSEARSLETENITTGGLTPHILVELYTGPTFPTPPRISFSPQFPGIVAIWIENTNSYPIYDVEVFLFNQKGTNGMMSEIAKKFNEKRESIPIMKLRDGPVILLPPDFELPRAKFDFSVKTRRGSTRHSIVFELVTNKWEFARVVTDTTHRTNRVLVVESSASFPKDVDGKPRVD